MINIMAAAASANSMAYEIKRIGGVAA